MGFELKSTHNRIRINRKNKIPIKKLWARGRVYGLPKDFGRLENSKDQIEGLRIRELIKPVRLPCSFSGDSPKAKIHVT